MTLYYIFEYICEGEREREKERVRYMYMIVMYDDDSDDYDWYVYRICDHEIERNELIYVCIINIDVTYSSREREYQLYIRKK